MKKILVIISLLLAIAFLNKTYSQEPPHPPQTGHGLTGNQSPNGSAPIGGGSVVLVVLSMLYAGKKVATSLKKEE
jgi:hypothetical protein